MTASIFAGASYFAVVMAAGFVLGVIRILVLVPSVGESAAVAVELPVMLVFCWYVCGFLVRTFAVPRSAMPRLSMGILAFVLLMIAEVGLSVFLFERSLADHLRHVGSTPGLMGFAGQVAFALFPVVQMASEPERRS
ncbi:MAG: hypothetical protein ACR2PA_24510 [Hyphomicrobiaceae bacterium]